MIWLCKLGKQTAVVSAPDLYCCRLLLDQHNQGNWKIEPIVSAEESSEQKILFIGE